MAYAHSMNQQRQRQDLVDHLQRVAEQARIFADPFGAGEVAYAAGLLHDVGKFDPAWQRYLLAAEASPQQKHRGPDHKGAGACRGAELNTPPLAFLIKGHHGGLPALPELKPWLRERAADPAVQQAWGLAQRDLPALTTLSAPVLPSHITTETALELFMRLAFSALVDADFLDTERHFSAATGARRTGAPEMASLWTAFESDQHRLMTGGDGIVNVARREVYEACLKAADLAPGFFRLTVPTGGGKTRSSLAFALRHAMRHGLARIIYAIPYTSIVEQTCDVFRAIFADDRAVLEHHSAARVTEDELNPAPTEIWARLAAENWDAPLVVTTTVQLFESLLSHRTTACRKLHNVAHSVIILDEAQMLPTHLLTTILDALRELVAHYGVTVVLCTATQPALDDRSGFAGLPDIREMVSEPERLFAQLARVTYEWPAASETWAWERAADEMRASEQALAVVNTRADALALLTALDDPAALHLSTRLCGAHRRAVLRDVRERLERGAPCRLVATQVIEAGVDVDFPLVLRALGPLDRVVQAAGRCNREGKLSAGRVVIFAPAEGGLPPGAYRVGAQITRTLMRGEPPDMHDPALYTRYFQDYYRQVNLDEPDVQAARRRLDYPETDSRFRMIEDDAASVVVRYGTGEEQGAIKRAMADLRAQRGSPRALLRQLQPYLVGLRQRELEQAQRDGLVEEVMPGVWEWLGHYDVEGGAGIALDGAMDPERTIWSSGSSF